MAFPTETVYGLGADAFNAQAVARIFTVKRRPASDPLIVHIADPSGLRCVAAGVSEPAQSLAERFWPGPLTLVLPRAQALPREVTAGLDTVAVRMPDHPVALALIREAGTPIAAPSANLFGHVSPTTAEHVWDDLGEQVDLILDGGPTPIGVESTVLDLSGERPTILRPGGVSRETLAQVLGDVALRTQGAEERRSPGLFEKHYAPHAELILFRGETTAALKAMKEYLGHLMANNRKVGVLVVSEDKAAFTEYPVLIEELGRANDLEQIAARLFAAMRELERRGADVILVRTFSQAGLGLAIDDRLIKASGGRIINAA